MAWTMEWNIKRCRCGFSFATPRKVGRWWNTLDLRVQSIGTSGHRMQSVDDSGAEFKSSTVRMLGAFCSRFKLSAIAGSSWCGWGSSKFPSGSPSRSRRRSSRSGWIIASGTTGFGGFEMERGVEAPWCCLRSPLSVLVSSRSRGSRSGADLLVIQTKQRKLVLKSDPRQRRQFDRRQNQIQFICP